MTTLPAPDETRQAAANFSNSSVVLPVPPLLPDDDDDAHSRGRTQRMPASDGSWWGAVLPRLHACRTCLARESRVRARAIAAARLGGGRMGVKQPLRVESGSGRHVRRVEIFKWRVVAMALLCQEIL